MRLRVTDQRPLVLLRLGRPAASPLLSFRYLSNMGEGRLIEEQALPFYHQKRYYPVRIGDTLKDRYRIIAKLGYGGYSTVWLAWDNRFEQPYLYQKIHQTDSII